MTHFNPTRFDPLPNAPILPPLPDTNKELKFAQTFITCERVITHFGAKTKRQHCIEVKSLRENEKKTILE